MVSACKDFRNSVWTLRTIEKALSQSALLWGRLSNGVMRRFNHNFAGSSNSCNLAAVVADGITYRRIGYLTINEIVTIV